MRTQDFLKEIPLTVPGNHVVYLGDVARIFTDQDPEGSIAHHNGQDAVILSVSKQQSATSAEVSKEVSQTIRALTAADSGLAISVVNDASEDIRSSLISIAETILLAVGISMGVIWLFFGISRRR